MKSPILSKNTCFIEYQQKKLNNSDKNATYLKKVTIYKISNMFKILE